MNRISRSIRRRAALLLAAAGTLAGVYSLPPAPLSHEGQSPGSRVLAER
jgi:hypothetical protein